MLSGRVLPGSKTSPWAGLCSFAFFPKQMRRPRLNVWPSGRVSVSCMASGSDDASSDCDAVAASSKTCNAWLPERFQAAYGMPSGPGAEQPASFTAFLISLMPMRHRDSSVSSGGLELQVLGASSSRSSSGLRRRASGPGKWVSGPATKTAWSCATGGGRWICY